MNCSFDYLSQTLENKLYVGFLFAGAFFIPVSVIMYSYIRVAVAVKQSRQSLLDMSKVKSTLLVRTFKIHKRQVKNYETAKIGMKLITMFVLSWGPYACVAFIGQFVSPSLIFPLVQLIPVVMAKSASVWNPIVYAISHRRFKRELREIFLQKFFRGMTAVETTSGTMESCTEDIFRDLNEFNLVTESKASTAV